MYTNQCSQPTPASVDPTPATWIPLRKGTMQDCVCDREGCCSMITVLDTEANVLEIYQANISSLWSCIARIVLPEDIALCQRVRPRANLSHSPTGLGG